MLEFYEFNTFNICVVLISTFIIYYLLSNVFNLLDKEKNKDEFSIEYLIISVLLGVCLSLGVSYVMSANDEALLTENYWENTIIE